MAWVCTPGSLEACRHVLLPDTARTCPRQYCCGPGALFCAVLPVHAWWGEPGGLRCRLCTAVPDHAMVSELRTSQQQPRLSQPCGLAVPGT